MKRDDGHSRRVAVGGLFAALIVVVLLLNNLLPFATLALVGIAAVLLLLFVLEFGWRWAALVFVASGVLCFFVVADRKVFLLYVLVFGLYALLKPLMDRIGNPVLRWGVKIVFGVAAGGGYYLLFTTLFGVPEIMNKVALPLVAALALAVYILFDWVVTRALEEYYNRIRKKFSRFLD